MIEGARHESHKPIASARRSRIDPGDGCTCTGGRRRVVARAPRIRGAGDAGLIAQGSVAPRAAKAGPRLPRKGFIVGPAVALGAGLLIGVDANAATVREGRRNAKRQCASAGPEAPHHNEDPGEPLFKCSGSDPHAFQRDADIAQVLSQQQGPKKEEKRHPVPTTRRRSCPSTISTKGVGSHTSRRKAPR